MTWLDSGWHFLNEFLQYRISFDTLAYCRAQRDLLALAYASMVYKGMAAPYDADPGFLAELQAQADEHAPGLQGKDRINFMKAVMVLTRLAEIRLQEVQQNKNADQKAGIENRNENL